MYSLSARRNKIKNHVKIVYVYLYKYDNKKIWTKLKFFDLFTHKKKHEEDFERNKKQGTKGKCIKMPLQ